MSQENKNNEIRVSIPWQELIGIWFYTTTVLTTAFSGIFEHCWTKISGFILPFTILKWMGTNALHIDWLTSLFKTRGPFHRLCYVLFNGDVYLY
jgi:hypothetical protein